jgi:galactan endo-1,6-beta-galactosidase
MSEYGDGDSSGYTMAQTIIRDVKELQPSAWVYWQPVEPDVRGFGWGLANANYVDNQDRPNSGQKTELVRVNRKFFVYGQFTRYVRQGYHLIEIGDRNSIAAYDPGSHRFVIVKVTGDRYEPVTFGLSNFSSVGETVQVIATTTAPGGTVPDWRQHEESLRLTKSPKRMWIEARLYPKSLYTFVIEDVLP